MLITGLGSYAVRSTGGRDSGNERPRTTCEAQPTCHDEPGSSRKAYKRASSYWQDEGTRPRERHRERRPLEPIVNQSSPAYYYSLGTAQYDIKPLKSSKRVASSVVPSSVPDRQTYYARPEDYPPAHGLASEYYPKRREQPVAYPEAWPLDEDKPLKPLQRHRRRRHASPSESGDSDRHRSPRPKRRSSISAQQVIRVWDDERGRYVTYDITQPPKGARVRHVVVRR